MEATYGKYESRKESARQELNEFYSGMAIAAGITISATGAAGGLKAILQNTDFLEGLGSGLKVGALIAGGVLLLVVPVIAKSISSKPREWWLYAHGRI